MKKKPTLEFILKLIIIASIMIVLSLNLRGQIIQQPPFCGNGYIKASTYLNKSPKIEEIKALEQIKTQPLVSNEILKGFTDTAVTIIDQDVSMTIDYGFDGYAKYGRYMNIKAAITSTKDFTGWIEIIIPKMENQVVYRRYIQVTSGETQIESLVVPITDDTGILTAKLIGNSNNVILEYDGKIKIGNYLKQAYIGVLTDDQESLKYLNLLGDKIIWLDEDILPENPLGLDLLDVLVINQYDSTRLSEAHIRAIDAWVRRGGTLVLGTGEHSRETLAGFMDMYKIESKDNLKNIVISFGLDKQSLQDLKQNIISYSEERNFQIEDIKNRNEVLKSLSKKTIDIDTYNINRWNNDNINQLKLDNVNKDVVELHIPGSFTAVEDNNYGIFKVKNLGKGTLQLISFDIGLDEKDKTIGAAIIGTITKNMSVYKQRQLSQEYYGSNLDYGIIRSMSYTDTENVPKTMTYLFVILLYLLLVGPLCFYVLKKLDKLNYIWATIPCLAIIFMALIFFLGSDTRINDPYAGFVEVISFTENNRVNNETYFSLTAPFNKKYTVELEDEYEISNISENNYGSYMFNYQSSSIVDVKNYLTAINYIDQNTVVEINNNPAFTPVYFQTNSSYPKENKVTFQIEYVGDEIKGSITNGFDFNLSSSMIQSDGYLINVGPIKMGETVTLEGKEALFLSIRGEMYNEVLNRIAGGTGDYKDNTPTINRNLNVITNLLEHHLSDNYNESCFIGILEETDQSRDGEKYGINNPITASKNLVQDLKEKMDTKGTRAMVIPVKVNYTREDVTFVPSIDPYLYEKKEYSDFHYDKYYGSRYVDSDIITMEYHLPEDDKIISFEYLKSRNEDQHTQYLKPFEGEISILNLRTGAYDVVFMEGVGSRVTDISDYITDNNVITIRYNTQMSLKSTQMLLPFISYWKEVDTNAENY